MNRVELIPKVKIDADLDFKNLSEVNGKVVM